MRISHVALIVTVISLLSALGGAQAYPPRAAASSAPAPSGPTAAPVSASALLQPALSNVHQTIGALRLEKWKRGTVRDEANDNIDTILNDMQTDLPPLLRVADADPGTLTKQLPVSRNVDALYDVLLRVYEASRVAAPGEQVSELERALLGLSKARLTLDQRIQASALALEKQVSTLSGVLQAESVTQCPVTLPPLPMACITPVRHRRVVRRRRVHVKAVQKKPAASTNKGTTQNQGK